MRLWSLHPVYLDRKGLVAVWRESLLAQAVLRGRTKGYKNHPQLERFKQARQPLESINLYLYHIYLEAVRRGYKFDYKKIRNPKHVDQIGVTYAQLNYEVAHLKAKVAFRDIEWFNRLLGYIEFIPHPLFRLCVGGIESWERQKDGVSVQV